MRITPEFPEHRLRDPKWQAERRVYEALEACDIPGHVLYGARAYPSCRELDFLVLLEDTAHLALENKGGNYRLVGIEWRLQTPEDWQRVPNPLSQVWDASMQLRDALGEHSERKPFIIPMLVFPDMKQDQAIEERCLRAGVHAIFGLDNLAESLLEIAGVRDVFFPPTAEDIRRQVELIMPGATIEEDTAGNDTIPEELELQARQVVIQRAEVVNVYTTAEKA